MEDINEVWKNIRESKTSEIIPNYNSAELKSKEADWRSQSQSFLQKKLGISPRVAGNITGGPDGELSGAGLADIPNTTGTAAAFADWKQDPSYMNSLNLTAQAIPGAGVAKAMFVGLGAKLTPQMAKAFKEATQLERAGIKNEETRQLTGWFRGRDNQFRTEISDENALIKDPQINATKINTDESRIKLSEIIDHPELFKLYPELENIKVKRETSPLADGSYDRFTNTIGLTPRILEEFAKGDFSKAEELRKIILHEIQHGVQEKEGFARGGNSRYLGEKLGTPVDPNSEYRQMLKMLNQAEEEFYKKNTAKSTGWESAGDRRNGFSPVSPEVHNKIIAVLDKYEKQPNAVIKDKISGKEYSILSFPTYELNNFRRKENNNWFNFISNMKALTNTVEKHGKSKDPFYRRLADDRRVLLKDLESIPEINSIMKIEQAKKELETFFTREPGLEEQGRDFYNRAGGEVEARNVETRRNMTMEERMKYPPDMTADVPSDKQINYRSNEDLEKLKEETRNLLRRQ